MRFRERVYPVMTVYQAARFWQDVAVCAHGDPCPSCCWPWQWRVNPAGYGVYDIGYSRQTRVPVNTHRLVWLFTSGDIPEGQHVLHRCDHPPCCNPQHLWLGTHEENVADMVRKGRSALGNRNGSRTHPERFPRGTAHYSHTHPELVPRGEQHHNAKLTATQVQAIRALRGRLSIAAIARQFGLDIHHVWDILHRKTWKHLLAPAKEWPDVE